MKCIPMTLSALFVAAAIFVIEIDDVFVARITSSEVRSSKSENIFSFKSMFSVAASITKSIPLTPSFKFETNEIFLRASSLSETLIFSFAT